MATHIATAPIIDSADFIDNRRGARQPLAAPATLFDEGAPYLSPGMEIYVINISLAGIGFQSDHRAPVGSTHRVHLITSTMRLNSRIRVTRCDETNGSYEIGAEFIED